LPSHYERIECDFRFFSQNLPDRRRVDTGDVRPGIRRDNRTSNESNQRSGWPGTSFVAARF
jgi:hypothetical protein